MVGSYCNDIFLINTLGKYFTGWIAAASSGHSGVITVNLPLLVGSMA
jgi:hypothetical protein